jgi:DNA-binding response OmpR family regulator
MKKILVIEDNAEIRENTAEILELANYKVFTAEDGKTGIEIALHEKPDLILCDVMMPGLDGYGVLHLVHKNPVIRNTPFIFMSARAERAEMRKGMELGADDYITKPFEKTELLQAIESRLKRAEWLKQDVAYNENQTNGFALSEFAKTSNERDILNLLSENRDVNKYKRKQIIYVEGNRPARLYYIKKGKVKTYKTNEEGKELIVGIYGEGDFLGYVALLEGTVYKERAEAMENTELAVIPKDEFDCLMSTRREVVTKFMTMLAKNITEKEQLLLGLAYNSLRKKVADALIAVNKKYNRTTINLSRENLAAIAGTATASMIRTLSEFKSEKLIDITEGAITILNEKELENLLN